ncbi:MAG: alpha/beta hydrolase [Planctomycetes bacterium]|nr:alpha/beta hydrolase [Planctomycetota bacterium]
MDAARIRHMLRLLTVALALCTVGIALLSPRVLHGEEVACLPAVPDVWVVSTRGLPEVCRLPESVNFHVQRLRPDGSAWERSDLSGLLDDPTRPVMVFIHGNRYTPAEARQQGLDLARRAAGCCGSGLRIIIYSWPSEQQGILLKDGRSKYQRSYSEGRYLAWLLGQFEPERPVAIVGYSFGAIITLEAIDDLLIAEQAGNGTVRPLTGRSGPVNVVFIAAAVRSDALAPRGPYRDALDHIDRLTLLVNSDDDALRFFPFLDCRQRAEALGFVGMPRRWMPMTVPFSSFDAAGIVGRTHGFQHYLASPSLMRRICEGATTGLETTAD